MAPGPVASTCASIVLALQRKERTVEVPSIQSRLRGSSLRPLVGPVKATIAGRRPISVTAANLILVRMVPFQSEVHRFGVVRVPSEIACRTRTGSISKPGVRLSQADGGTFISRFWGGGVGKSLTRAGTEGLS